ncbi:MAG: helix-turn-helix transcriptional regulator [Candidatus Dormibacteraceae bacterium]
MTPAPSTERAALDLVRRPGGGLGEPQSGSPALWREQEPRFLRIDELGDLLRVSRSTAYAMVASGLIPSVRVSPRVLRVDRIELEHWLTSRGAQ